MPDHYTEAQYESAVLQLFQERLGYACLYGPDADRDYSAPLYEELLLPALQRINRDMPMEAVDQAVRRLRDLGGGSLAQKNMVFMDYLQNGVTVEYLENGRPRSGLVYLVDYSSPDNNDFTAANQWTFLEYAQGRLDIVLFVNGLPLAVMELKSPSRMNADASSAYRQLRRYMRELPSLFAYNAVCVVSDLAASRAGTITSGENRFMEWKSRDGSYESGAHGGFDTFFEGMFEKRRFLDILKNFICFRMEAEGPCKILAGYHQYFAVKKAVASARAAAAADGKGGVFWHTQGSGKSLSMLFYARALQSALESPTIVVITDRNELDGQLYSLFSQCREFLRQTPRQARSRRHLKELLADRETNGIIFSTMQKFEEGLGVLSPRRNIVVIADEAHRGHYGLREKVVMRQGEAHTVVGTARVIRDSLPNATYIGFTGTPISSRDRSTREVFGDYIDIYDMTQAVEDGATRPVYYESRVVHLRLDQEALRLMDAEYDRMAQSADPYVIGVSKQELGRMETILGSDQAICSLVDDILDHYEHYRAGLLTGKAMIVAYSRAIAMKLYRRILELRPGWGEKVALVMTQGAGDSKEWREIIGSQAHREELARRFKDDASPLKIAIVVDMWLTGFDVPSLATMYVYKPMSGHNLMQAIARVNRVFGDKEGGLVVDYVGLATALKQAMHDYTRRDRQNYGDPDIGKTAYFKFLEKLSVCQDLFHGYDYSAFLTGTDLDRAKVISGGVNFLLGRRVEESGLPDRERTHRIYLREALLLRQSLSLCSSLADRRTRLEAAFFEAVRTMLLRLTGGGGGQRFTLPEINQRISGLLRQSVQSEGVINLFADVKAEFSLFDPRFLEEIAQAKEKNLAVELLKKLIEEQVSVCRRTNVVKSEAFSQVLREIMGRYLRGMLTNEEVIQELLRLARDITAAGQEGGALGLSPEELAFYDALAKPGPAGALQESGALVPVARELTDTLRSSCTIDWQKKESAQAGMRRLIKRLLKRNGYPQEGMEEAVQAVMRQCEMWTDPLEDD